MNTITSSKFATVIAQAGSTDTWFDSDIGRLVTTLLAGAGLVVVLLSAFRAFGKFAKGSTADGFRAIATGVAIAALLFNPKILPSMVNAAGGIIESLTNSTDQIIEDNGGGGGPDNAL